MKVLLTHEPLDLTAALAEVTRPDAGAIDVFLGIVRRENAGREVVTLEYSAYEPMALREMAQIVADLQQASDVQAVVAHRLGVLTVGDIAVICAVSTPHRGEAFQRCRTLIDEIKARVPIWKRETGPDGAAWVGWVDARCHGDEHHAPHHESGDRMHTAPNSDRDR
jgi:molybdopterin synthase catalytic subunit